MRTELAESIGQRPLLADGAMGTELQRAGLEPGACGELWNLHEPLRVERIHRHYVAAGAELVITNTFGGSRYALARHGAAEHVTAINRAGADIARRAAGNSAWVLGDIGPFGGFLAPLGDHDEPDVYAAFLEQARALVAGGVDGLIVETMSALEEAILAVRAARDAGAALVIGSMAFDATRVGPRTMMGVAPEQAATALVAAGAAVVGANCGTGLTTSDHVDIVRRYRLAVSGTPILTQPNAGQPERLADGGLTYRNDADIMAAGIEALLDAGAAIVGGCCGTTPEHIRAFASVVAEAGGRGRTGNKHGLPAV